MTSNIIDYLRNLHINNTPIPEHFEKLNHYVENGLFIEPETDQEMFFYGLYFEETEEYEKMKKYYLMAIEKGNCLAMNNLGMYYYSLEDFDTAKKYLLKGVEKDNIDCIVNLGTYYNNIENNFDEAIRYHEMAVTKGNVDAMFNLGLIYKKKKDYENMMKYFMMVFDKGDEYDIEHAESYLYNRKKFKILADVYYRQKLYLKLQHLIEEMVFAEERFTPKIIDFIEKAGEHFNEDCHPFLKSYYKLLKSKVDINFFI